MRVLGNQICSTALQGVELLYLYEVQTILLASEVVTYGSSVDVVSALNTIKAAYTAGN